MTKTRLIAILGIAGITFACKPNRVFDAFQDLSPNYTWEKSDPKVFQVQIADANVSYSTSVGFRYVEGYRYPGILMNAEITGPDSFSLNKQYEVVLRDENGAYIGEPALDIWDCEQLVDQGLIFPKPGTYTFKLSHSLPREKVNFSMEVGLMIDKEID